MTGDHSAVINEAPHKLKMRSFGLEKNSVDTSINRLKIHTGRNHSNDKIGTQNALIAEAGLVVGILTVFVS